MTTMKGGQNDDFREEFPDIGVHVKNKVKTFFTLETLKDFFPILRWLPQYKLSYLVPDIFAGITVALTCIPQSIADAAIARISPEYGLYSAFMGCFIYILFGNSKDVTIGPTSLVSLLMQVRIKGNADLAILAAFLCGFIILLMGILKLGVVVQFISMPVVTAFTTASAITIASSQVNNLFGLSSPSNEFIDSWENIFTHLDNILWRDAVLGVCTLIILLLLRKVRDIPTKKYKMLFRYISISRNILAVVVGIILAYYLKDGDWLPFRVSGKITPGLPPFKLPEFNTTINDQPLGFMDMVNELGFSLIWTPIIAVLEAIAVIKTFSKGKIVPASQEMIALGLCNVMGSFVGSMPVTGSFTRTAINNTSGVRTQLGGVITGTIVLLAIMFLASTFYYIPKATLAAIIIAAMIQMVEVGSIVEIWMSKKLDFVPFLVTFLCSLFWNIEYGILTGTIVNVVFILWKSARPQLEFTKEKVNSDKIGLVTINCYGLDYAAGEYLKSKIIKFKATQGEEVQKVIINGEHITNIDSTVAKNIISLKDDMEVLNCELICWNWSREATGVICRIKKSAQNMFKYASSLEELLKNLQTAHSTVTIMTIEE